jgi:hypothetical protein
MAPPPTNCSYPGFVSYKSEAPIYYQHRWHRDALIQMTLDQTISALAPLPSGIGPLSFRSDLAFVARVGKLDFLAIVIREDRPLAEVKGWTGPILKVSRADLREPAHLAATKSVWSRSRFTVNPVDRIAAIVRCRECAPEATVLDILPVLRPSFSDPMDQLLALLAQGYLVANLRDGLTPDTVVMPGPLAQSKVSQRPLNRLKNLEPCRRLMEDL